MNTKSIPVGAALSAALALGLYSCAPSSTEGSESQFCGSSQPPSVSFAAEDSATYDWPDGCKVVRPDILCSELSRTSGRANVVISQGGDKLTACYR